MRINHDDAIEALGAAQLAIINATADNARTAKARLGATLRNACAGASEAITHLSDAALAESDFLLEMAWTPGTSDPALFEPQRRRFAVAMDRLIYEVGVTRIRPSTPTDDRHGLGMRVPTYDRFSLVKVRLTATLAEWARKTRDVGSWSTLGKPSRGAQPLPRRSARRQDAAGMGS
jgi:hypothetical protein